MQRARTLAVAGAFGIDTSVYIVGDRQGAEMTFASVVDAPGQAGCYSAFAAAALGVPTRAIAALGGDRLGRWVRGELEAAGIGVVELRDPGGTHRSVNLVAADGSRRNYFDPRRVSEVVLGPAGAARALDGVGLLHTHLDDWCRHLLPFALDAGVTISCDLQDVLDIDDAYRADFVRAADVLFLSGANLADPAAAAVELAGRRRDRVVVVGDGARGCLVADASGVERYPVAELAEPVHDTNGAGDNLAVGFLVAHVLEGRPIERAARRAQLGARWICTQPGDAKAPLTRAQLDALEARSA